MSIFSKSDIVVLTDIMKDRKQEWPTWLEDISRGNISIKSVDAICDLLLSEYLMNGIRSSYEPNAYGLHIERLIDKMNKLTAS